MGYPRFCFRSRQLSARGFAIMDDIDYDALFNDPSISAAIEKAAVSPLAT